MEIQTRHLPSLTPADERSGHASLREVPIGPFEAPGAFTVDVEEYFQVGAFEAVVARETWGRYPSRLANGLSVVEELLDEAGVRATFFVLGWVAERHAPLIRRLSEAGHEIACHGWDHRRVFGLSREAFRADLRRARRTIEEVTGARVRGYRAPSFSLDRRTPWAHAILEEEGFAYSSSIFPGRTDHYGMPGAPRWPYRPLRDGRLWECPVTTLEVFGRRLPWAGGGYFRLVPYRLFRAGCRRLLAARRPLLFYCHPWEFDPAQPMIKGAGLRSRWRHRLNLARMAERVRRLLGDFEWGPMDGWLRRDTFDGTEGDDDRR